jgi:hypothetical protein
LQGTTRAHTKPNSIGLYGKQGMIKKTTKQLLSQLQISRRNRSSTSGNTPSFAKAQSFYKLQQQFCYIALTEEEAVAEHHETYHLSPKQKKVFTSYNSN